MTTNGREIPSDGVRAELSPEPLLAELQLFPFVAGLCLPSVLISVGVGIQLGGWWIVPSCLLALAALLLVVYSIFRGELARNEARPLLATAIRTPILERVPSGSSSLNCEQGVQDVAGHLGNAGGQPLGGEAGNE